MIYKSYGNFMYFMVLRVYKWRKIRWNGSWRDHIDMWHTNRTRPCQGCHFNCTVTTQLATYTHNFQKHYFPICIPLLQSCAFMADKVNSFVSLYLSFLHGSPVVKIITKFSRTSSLTLNELVPNRHAHYFPNFFIASVPTQHDWVLRYKTNRKESKPQ